MNREGKIDFLKKIIRGEVPKQALTPPEFRIYLSQDGIIHFTIDGIPVTKEFFHSERERLYSDFSFDIEFRNPNGKS